MIDEVVDAESGLVIVARVRGSEAGCQACAVPSSRVHSRYRRTLADAPVAGRPFRILLWVRRFFCGNTDCRAKTFTTQVDGMTRRWSRVSEGLRQMLTTVGLALAGRAGARLAAALGMPASRHRLIRLVRALPDPPVGVVAVLGVDDFAIRRGHHYGTVHKSCLNEPTEPCEPSAEEAGPGPTNEPTGVMAERRRAHHALVHKLLAQGAGFRQIARHLGWSHHTVSRYANAETWQDMMVGQKIRPSLVDPFKSYLTQRINEGCLKATTLHREIRAQGFVGSYAIVRKFVEQYRSKPDLTPVRRPPSVTGVRNCVRAPSWCVRSPKCSLACAVSGSVPGSPRPKRRRCPASQSSPRV
ncbi:transposase family protein [Dactylosporangium sp. NPDC049742]|uniref:helix-turn-helix domain-containing protein n=1 Tax=Dactylosporangium sp. NPDC049742 TaxID=3154737 RepID=UPI003426DA5D